MALTNAFKEAVSSNNVRRVRIMMKDSLLNDPTFSEFNMMNSAACDLSGLYDTHDGRELNNNKRMWNDSYMSDLMVEIVYNFSIERVEHLKDVVRQLRPVANHSQVLQPKSTNYTDSEKPRDYTNRQRNDNPKQNYHEQQNSNRIVGGAIMGAVAGGTIAAVASASVIGGIAIGAVAGAIVVTVVTNGE